MTSSVMGRKLHRKLGGEQVSNHAFDGARSANLRIAAMPDRPVDTNTRPPAKSQFKRSAIQTLGYACGKIALPSQLRGHKSVTVPMCAHELKTDYRAPCCRANAKFQAQGGAEWKTATFPKGKGVVSHVAEVSSPRTPACTGLDRLFSRGQTSPTQCRQ